MKKEIESIPEELYLVLGEEIEDVEDFGELDTENVLWSESRVFETDVHYIRASQQPVSVSRETVEKMLEALKAIHVDIYNARVYDALKLVDQAIQQAEKEIKQ